MLPCIASWAFSYIVSHFLKKIFASKEKTPSCPVCAAPINRIDDEIDSSYNDRIYDINKRGKAGNLIVEQVLDRGIWNPKVSKELKNKMKAGAEMGLSEGKERMDRARQLGMQRMATWKEKRNGENGGEDINKVDSMSI